MIWQIFARKEPFYGLPLYELMNKVIHEQFRPPIEEVEGEELRALICQCWSPDPEVRPEFAEILKRLQEMPIPASVLEEEGQPSFSLNAPSHSASSTPADSSLREGSLQDMATNSSK